MQKTLFSLLCGLTLIAANAQPKKVASKNQSIERPKLVVGIVVDQMRWDFLYRYYDQYKPDGGFKRLLGEGFTCENTMIPYAPTITACGHTCAYTAVYLMYTVLQVTPGGIARKCAACIAAKTMRLKPWVAIRLPVR